MKHQNFPGILPFFGIFLVPSIWANCIRSPVGQTRVDRTEGNNGFHLEIRNNPRNDSSPQPEGYVPGETYTVVLKGYKTQYTVQTFRGFSIVAISDQTKSFEEGIGNFQLNENVDPARRSSQCYHAVEQVSLHPKTEVALKWRAPDSNVGCIEFRAMVLEYRDIWYMDDGPLTKKFCQIIGYEKLVPQDGAEECCACDEAKYELTFDGIWSRQTHPKDYPSLEHLTHFSDVIGASHSNKYTMWALNNYATDGLKELAEWGNTYQMEQELKENPKEIRTIIKARGLWFPHVQGTAKSIFRVDKYNHLVSLASMLGPSPDWLVGITKVNLCLPDCSWVGERSFDLLPFDAGTDSGVSYMAPNNPTLPREKIRKITNLVPSDPRAPFYSPTKSIPPLAKLIIKREKVYPMECKNISEYKTDKIEGTSEDLEYNDRRECMVGEWTPWSLCSATCGKGIRMRSRIYKFPVKAQMFNCERQMIKKEFCNAALSVCEDSEAFNDDCSVSSWSLWTECSVTCETGTRSRTRNYHNPENAGTYAKCSVDLQETNSCIGAGGDDCSVTPDPRCRMTFWSQWSPCSASCGEGMRVRTRLFYYPESSNDCGQYSLMEKENCNKEPCRRFYGRHSDEICQEPVEDGQCEGYFPRYYFDYERKACLRFVFKGCKGNRNNFETKDQCMLACSNDNNTAEANQFVPANHLAAALGVDQEIINDGGAAVDCMVSEWSPWSECSRSCGRGRRQRTRFIKVFPRNNGQACPTNLIQRRRCSQRPCPISEQCRATAWSQWSPCSVTCGQGVKVRQRLVLSPGRRNQRYSNQSRGCNMSTTNQETCEIMSCTYVI